MDPHIIWCNSVSRDKPPFTLLSNLRDESVLHKWYNNIDVQLLSNHQYITIYFIAGVKYCPR